MYALNRSIRGKLNRGFEVGFPLSTRVGPYPSSVDHPRRTFVAKGLAIEEFPGLLIGDKRCKSCRFFGIPWGGR